MNIECWLIIPGMIKIKECEWALVGSDIKAILWSLSPNQGSRTRYLPCDWGYWVFWSSSSHDINAVYSIENIRVSSIMKLTMWQCVKSLGNYLVLLPWRVVIEYTCQYISSAHMCAVLKHVPSWNMLWIGIVCHSEKCAILKHASDWQCENFVIIKARSWSKTTCGSRSKVWPSYCICLFVCISVMNVELLQIQWVQKTPLLSALNMATFVQRQSEACFKMAHF